MNRIVLSLLLLTAASPLAAQISSADELLIGGVADGNKLIAAYTRPFVAGLSTSLASGWYNTALTHKPGRFSLTVFGAVSIVPSADQVYDARTLGLTNFNITGGTSSPTIVGNDTKGQTANVTNPDGTGRSPVSGGTGYQLPEGVGIPLAPGAGLQLSIGTVKNTDVMVRFLPNLSFGDNQLNIGYFGFGIKHDWKQWIPGLKKVPFHSAIIFGYNRITGDLKLDLTRPGGVSDPEPNRPIDNQRAEYSSNSYLVGLIASKKFSVFTLYGGALYMWSENNLKLTGTYPIASYEGTASQRIIYAVNPVSVDANSPNSLGINAGFRLKFGWFTYHLDYTLAKYMMVNTGFGFSFGERDAID
jgi:hypothetical protein